MPDWQQLVREQLSQLQLDAGEKEEVCVELAAHLEEDHQSSLRQGASELAAIHRALQHVNDWQDLRARIESSRKKEFPMTKRVSQVWLPGFSALFLATVLLALIQSVGPTPPVVSINWGWGTSHGLRIGPVAVVYFSWLLFLPLIGALGGYLSFRAAGSFRAALLSVLFPVLPFVVALPLTVIFDDYVAHNITVPAFFVGLFLWVIFPAVALLAGGLPVHMLASRRLNRAGVAGS